MTPAFNCTVPVHPELGALDHGRGHPGKGRRRSLPCLLRRVRSGSTADAGSPGDAQRLGHDVSGLHSKSWDEFVGPDAPRMDFVIALCDTLHGQNCPDLGNTAVTAAWPLPDPAKFTGSASQRAPPAERTLRQPAGGGSRSSSACPSPRSTGWLSRRGWTNSAAARWPLRAEPLSVRVGINGWAASAGSRFGPR